MSVSLFSQVSGSGPALVILHGLFGSGDNWRTHALRLSRHYTVYVVDARNHGRSPHAPTISYPEMADDLLAFLDAQNIDKATILGHSMGGKVAMQFALAHPGRVQALIVGDIAPRQYPPHHQDVLMALNAVDTSTLADRRQAETILAQYLPEASTQQFLLKSLYRTDEGGFAWRFNFPVLRNQYANVAAGVGGTTPYTGRTLFLRGERSKYVQDEDIPHIRRLFPNMQLVTLPGAGHWIHAEAPEAFIQAVEQFLGIADNS